MESAKSQLPVIEGTKAVLGVFGVMVLLFCAFFWLGFFAGKHLKARTPGATESSEPAIEPSSERVEWQTTGHGGLPAPVIRAGPYRLM